MAGDVQNLLNLSLVQCSRCSSVIQLTLRQQKRQLHKEYILLWGGGGLNTEYIFDLYSKNCRIECFDLGSDENWCPST